MKKRIVLSKLIYFAVALALLGSMVVVGCAKEEAPTAPTEPTAPVTPTVPTEPTAPTTPAAGQPVYGGILRIANSAGQFVVGFPPKQSSTHDYRITSCSLENILHIDNGLNLVPWLATGYTTDLAARTVTLTLRKGVKFHDGTDFNAEAEKWILEQYKLVAMEGSGFIKSIDIIDDYTVRINLSQWDSTFFTALGSLLGTVYSPTAYEKNGADWALNHPVSTGPFVLTYFEREVVTKYKKWDGYWQEGLPYLDGIESTTIPTELTRELAFRNGEFDEVIWPATINTPQLLKDGYQVTSQTSPSGSTFLAPDGANPASPFTDIRVRQAACYAIDRDMIVEAVTKGLSEVSNQFAGYPAQFGYNPDVVGYPYNPTKAKELLAEAGYPTGFKTKFSMESTPGEVQTCMMAAQGYLKAVGIEAETELMTTAKLMAIGISGEKWTGLTQGYTRTGALDPLTALIQCCSGPKARVSMAKPREWLDAIEEARLAPDNEAKRKAMQKAAKLMVDKYCLIVPLYQRHQITAYQPWVRNFGWYVLSPYPGQNNWESQWMEKH